MKWHGGRQGDRRGCRLDGPFFNTRWLPWWLTRWLIKWSMWWGGPGTRVRRLLIFNITIKESENCGKTRWDVFEMLARSRLQGWKIVLVKCEHKFDELEIPDGYQFELEIPDGSNNNSTTNSDFLSNYSLQIGQMGYEGQVFFKFFFRFGLEGFLLAHLLPGDWFWLPPSFKVISLFKETGFQEKVILIYLCSKLWVTTHNLWPRFSVIWV